MYVLFADEPIKPELLTGVPNWLTVAAFFVVAILSPFMRNVWLLIREQFVKERTEDAETVRKNEAADDRRSAKLQTRIDANERRHQEEMARLSAQISQLYAWIMAREDKVGGWMLKVVEWFGYYTALLTQNGIEHKKFDVPPPELPPLPSPPVPDVKEPA